MHSSKTTPRQKKKSIFYILSGMRPTLTRTFFWWTKINSFKCAKGAWCDRKVGRGRDLGGSQYVVSMYILVSSFSICVCALLIILIWPPASVYSNESLIIIQRNRPSPTSVLQGGRLWQWRLSKTSPEWWIPFHKKEPLSYLRDA